MFKSYREFVRLSVHDRVREIERESQSLLDNKVSQDVLATGLSEASKLYQFYIDLNQKIFNYFAVSSIAFVATYWAFAKGILESNLEHKNLVFLVAGTSTVLLAGLTAVVAALLDGRRVQPLVTYYDYKMSVYGRALGLGDISEAGCAPGTFPQSSQGARAARQVVYIFAALTWIIFLVVHLVFVRL